jgi:hypothetical protein
MFKVKVQTEWASHHQTKVLNNMHHKNSGTLQEIYYKAKIE